MKQLVLAVMQKDVLSGAEVRKRLADVSGGEWLLNVGQVYQALDRLVREGSALIEGQTSRGAKKFQSTERGRTSVQRWLLTPSEVGAVVHDSLTARLLASSLYGRDLVAEVIAKEMQYAAERVDELNQLLSAIPSNPWDPARLINSAELNQWSARKQWLHTLQEQP